MSKTYHAQEGVNICNIMEGQNFVVHALLSTNTEEFQDMREGDRLTLHRPSRYHEMTLEIETVEYHAHPIQYLPPVILVKGRAYPANIEPLPTAT